MEGETQAPRCNVIYHCASAQDDIAALYHSRVPPDEAASGHNDKSLDLIYHNARVLLDQDRGGFKEVYLSSSQKQCLERLDIYANSAPTIVLVEVRESDTDTARQDKNGTAFLRLLKTNIIGARYQKDVLSFGLLVGGTSPSLESLPAKTTASFLKAGAEDIIASPITARGINHLVGHVMERTRPPARLIGSSMAQNLVESIRDTDSDEQPYHRPDEALSEERRQFVEDVVKRWAFPAHELDMDELTYAAVLMLEHILRDPIMEHYRLERAELVSFVLATRRQYKHEREVHYHNWRHAVDVTQSIYQFLTSIGLCPPAEPEEAAKKKRTSVEMLFSSLDGLMLLVSAIGHDVGHPGVNNAFLVACNHPLAQLYNDKSVLENYHCAAYSQLLRRHWPSLSRYRNFRQTLISNILATDMQRHFEYMSHLTDLREKLLESRMSVEEWSEKEKDSTRELMTALMMKAADISNIARPFDISAAWAKILINEFASQGDLESELEIPTCLFGGPPDKENLLAAAQSQKGFMNLFGFPLFQGLSDIVPSISCTVDTLVQNQKSWDAKIAEESQRQQTPGHATFQSLGSDHDLEVLQRHRQSEPAVVPANVDSPPSTPIRWQPGQHQSGSPVRHPASEEKKRLIAGFSAREDGKRASAPVIGGPGSLLIAPSNAASRRSSKDVALDQLHQLGLFTHQTGHPGSRRGSADASYQLNHSHPTSRRGSKDESLTTILVTQGKGGSGSPETRSGHVRHSSSSPHKTDANRQARQLAQKQTRNSVPSSHSHAASSGTATTGHSLSTQPSSVNPADDDDESPTIQLSTSSQSHDPFLAPSSKSSEGDDDNNTTTPPAPDQPSTASLLDLSSHNGKDNASPHGKARTTPEDSSDNNNNGRPPLVKDGQTGLRESRSRSRLRSLRFWRKKKEPTSIDSATDSVSP
ncbi:hypothetical protein AMS68_003765 [Peltaster fructicola]|uniref:Phosphodiesterase n=1 Tax=Peltaster fructicola TaxID=286661 RepID=A0A6H0XUF6_9PEZI|nr:hypothetical protein AMS68_003765 [Peltaster fructicola]